MEAQYSWAALVLTKIRIKWIFKRYFTSLFEQVVQPPRYELFYTLTNCKRSCLSSHLHRCKKRISPILCFWNCSISHIPSFLQTFYVDSIHVDFDMKWCSKSIHENALYIIQLWILISHKLLSTTQLTKCPWEFYIKTNLSVLLIINYY